MFHFLFFFPFSFFLFASLPLISWTSPSLSFLSPLGEDEITQIAPSRSELVGSNRLHRLNFYCPAHFNSHL